MQKGKGKHIWCGNNLLHLHFIVRCFHQFDLYFFTILHVRFVVTLSLCVVVVVAVLFVDLLAATESCSCFWLAVMNVCISGKIELH